MLSIVEFFLYIFFIISISLFSLRSYRFRLVLLCYLLFMFFIHPNVFSPTFFGGHARLPIALLLCITGWPELRKTLPPLHTAKILIPMLLWYFYNAFSVIIISDNSNYTLAYQQVGDGIIFMLVATYISSSTYKELLVILSSIILALTINLIAYIPKTSHMFSFIPMLGYYHHGGAGLSGFKMMPLLLFMYNRKHGKLAKILVLILMIFAGLMTFLSGSRTGMIGVVIILLVYKRTIRWWILLLLFGIIGFYLATNYADTTWGTDRVERLFRAFARGESSSLSEVEFRMSHLRIGYEAFQEQPILGYGYGSWSLIRGQAYDIIGSELAAHNAYALLMSETGLIGIVLFFTMIYFCIRRTNFKASSNYQYDLQYVTTIVIITYLLLGFNSSSFWSREFTIFVAISAGSKARLIMRSELNNYVSE